MNDTILGLPINRFVTFVQPLLNAGAGIVAAWLVAKVEILGILGIGEDQLATQIAALAAALIVTGCLEIGRSQWIKGHHIELSAEGGITVPANELDDQVDDPTKAPPDVGDIGRV